MRLILLALVAAALAVAGYVMFQNLTRPEYALEVDATRDTTDISGTLYRIRVVNIGTEQLTGITVDLGADDVQRIDSLDPGKTYYFYPEPETPPTTIRVTANEGIQIATDYRTPTKTLGLPGAGR